MASRMEFKIVGVNKLKPNPFQPRGLFEEGSLRELADSLKSRGQIQPIIVRKHKEGYQIIAGERRWRAAKFAGLKEVPILVKDTMEEDILLESLVENLHRLDLTSVERENAIYELWETDRWKTYEELGKTLGKSGGWVAANVGAALTRKKEKISAAISTRVIHDTVSLEKEDRKQIIKKFERKEITEPKIREYARIAKKAPQIVKEALLKPKSRITPTMAEKIMELPQDKQDIVIKQIEDFRLDEGEAINHIETSKVEVPLPPQEEIVQVRERIDQLQREFRAKLRTPKAIERGELFGNWTSHIAVAGVLDSLSCPVCKSKQLGWLCHELSIEDALSKAEKKYKKDINSAREKI